MQSFKDFNGTPWSPETSQITTFKEFIMKEVINAGAQQPAASNNGLFSNNNSNFFQASGSNNS